MEYRLNKYISNSGYCSRREADKLIEAGQVKVNGKKASIGDRVYPKQKVTVNGELIVNYSDGTSKNIGKVGGQCAGVYIPSYSEDGILTFALSEKAGEPSYSFDIDSTNDWNPVGDEKTTYVWNKL